MVGTNKIVKLGFVNKSMVKQDCRSDRQQLKVNSKSHRGLESMWQSKGFKGRRRFRRLSKDKLAALAKIAPIDPRLLFKHRLLVRQELNRDIRRAVGFQRVLERRALRRRTRRIGVYSSFRQRNRSMVVKSVRIIKKVDYFWRRVVLLPYRVVCLFSWRIYHIH
jgi:hypothetical protein